MQKADQMISLVQFGIKSTQKSFKDYKVDDPIELSLII